MTSRLNQAEARILVIDDQEANLMSLEMVLQLGGWEKVRCLSDSRQAFATAVEFQPDLILLDLHMPHMDGLAVLEQLAGLGDDNDYLPVLVLTGDGSSAAKEKALSQGAKDFLTKPLNRAEVHLRVRNLLQTRLLHQQLKAQNASLAEEVRERTHLAEELVATNRKLKQTHAQLVHSEKMASLGQLVAGIAHEINNPLTFVASNIHVLQRTLDWLAEPTADRTHADARPRLEKALVRMNDTRVGVERIANLVLKLRTFSRLDEGGRKTVNIHESIDSVLVFFQHRMAGRIEVVRRYGARDALTCFAGELNQVFSNLIANAVEAIEGAGSITVRTEERDGSFEFSVRDTGAGIPNEIRDRIFDPFFTTKPIGQGSGLGLAICYGIIQAHGGSIELIDDGQPGTEFIARVPRLLEPARDASAFPR